MSSGTSAPIAHHDVGGREAGLIEQAEHDYALWERRVDAMMMLLSSRGLLVVDEMRRHIESIGPDAYMSIGYYERWITALTGAMVERGVVSGHDLGQRMADVERRS